MQEETFIAVNVYGLEESIREVDNLKKWLKKRREVLRKIGDDVIYPEIRSVFAAGGKPRWVPLSPGYAKWKARRFPGKPILQATGKMRKSLVNKNDANAIYKLTEDEITIGSKYKPAGASVALALLHQKGTKRLPERKVFSEDSLKIIERGAVKTFEREFEKFMKQNMGSSKAASEATTK